MVLDPFSRQKGIGRKLKSGKSLVKKTLDEVSRDSEEETIEKSALKKGLLYMNLHAFPIDLEALAIIPKLVAAKADAICFFESNKQMKVGTIDPFSKEISILKQNLKKHDYKIEVYLISKSSLNDTLALYKKVPKEKPRQEKIIVKLSEEQFTNLKSEVKNLAELETKIKSLPMTEVIDVIIAGALQAKASDIHIEPEQQDVKLRYRVDGVLQDAASLPKDTHEDIVSRIKLLAKLKLNIKQKPQDGRFTANLGENEVDIRVSILPSGYGETIVLRLLGIGAVNLNISDLGFSKRDYEKIKPEIEKPNGMILTTGPTGSGKTTTLYAFLNQLNKPEVKIITLENPIEYRLKGISQTQIEQSKGYDFATGLKAILRQDPDIVMVGEIRDLDTAETALNAALTGHLVFSTLHTNDSAGVIPRLIDMGTRPFVIAPAINAVIAQRLVRKLCTKCRVEYKPTSEEVEKMKTKFETQNSTAKFPEITKLYKAKGCDECHHTGYSGRVGIFEVFMIDKEMEKLIMAAATTAEIFEASITSGMTTMEQDGIYKAAEGMTTFEEVERVT